MKRLIPYRIRLWWAKRKMPVCSCENPARPPFSHETDCPVFAAWVRDARG